MESVVSGPKCLDPSDQAAEGGNQGRRRSQRERWRTFRQTADVTVLSPGARKFQMRAIRRIPAKFV